LPERPTHDELLPRSLRGHCCRCRHNDTASAELARSFNAASAIPFDTILLLRRFAAYSPTHSLSLL
jgi:hypothetical protein